MEEVAGEAPAERLEMSGGNIQHTVIEYGIGQMPETGTQERALFQV